MWFLNIKTGVEWFIIDSSHQELLKQNDDYEIVEKEIEVIEVNEDIEIIDLESLKLKELQDLAKEREVNYSGLKKEALIESLKEVI